ncbi:unnamed protein product [Caenorhabditis auriculariae]|uniref:C3H1-type domain-containing protein n=1 Tax=Caenorhabditis auriculariae TaxID=2777116 RepID=A0A8S1H8T6_9PELO|nr:unnamed protein product [Caenorhabditis auriculariae]
MWLAANVSKFSKPLSSSMRELWRPLRSFGQSARPVEEKSRRRIGWWLMGCAGMCYGAVAIGGVTRLTESGLSMVNWDLFKTMKPPFSNKEWEAEFEKYKQYPEYQYKSPHKDMTLNEFKFIWSMEYGHRMWGRAIGLVFLIPCAYFWARGRFDSAMKKRMAVATALLLTQGGVGWWMVKSGLDPTNNSSDVPRVSQYRLATHLTLAFGLYAIFFWNGLSHLLRPHDLSAVRTKLAPLRGMTHGSKLLVFVTAIMGAFVAGLDAGLVYNSWPKFADKWIPENLMARSPTWKNFFENDVTVQFIHRNLAYLTVTSVVASWLVGRRAPLPRRTRIALNLTVAAVFSQATLGVLTLVNYVPVWLAACHQSDAVAHPVYALGPFGGWRTGRPDTGWPAGAIRSDQSRACDQKLKDSGRQILAPFFSRRHSPRLPTQLATSRGEHPLHPTTTCSSRLLAPFSATGLAACCVCIRGSCPGPVVELASMLFAESALSGQRMQQEKRPTSSMSTGSTDSGVFSSALANSRQPSLPSSATHTGPPSPAVTANLMHATNLMAVNEQLRKQLEESQSRQPFAFSPSQVNKFSSFENAPFDTLPQNQQIGRRNAERRIPKPESYKTVICQAWLESKTCSFAENCRFAHGEEELRPSKIQPRQNNKYKTKLCDKYTTNGLCPYGKRCLFIHPENGPNAYIRSDKLIEVSQRHALADLREQMIQQVTQIRPSSPIEPLMLHQQPVPIGLTPMRGRVAIPTRPHPSWPLEPANFFTERTIGSRPPSPLEPFLRHNQLLGTPKDKASTPSMGSGYISGGSTPFDVDSPFAHQSSLANHSLREHPNEDSFSLAPGFDHLAEDLARHLELW